MKPEVEKTVLSKARHGWPALPKPHRSVPVNKRQTTIGRPFLFNLVTCTPFLKGLQAPKQPAADPENARRRDQNDEPDTAPDAAE